MSESFLSRILLKLHSNSEIVAVIVLLCSVFVMVIFFDCIT